MDLVNIEFESFEKSVMDCSIGMAEFHLGGAQCDPHVKRIIAGYNPWQVDREAAGLLGLNWNNIGHIAAGFILSVINSCARYRAG